MARPKNAKNKTKVTKEFVLSDFATKLISKMHEIIVKEITAYDKKVSLKLRKA